MDIREYSAGDNGEVVALMALLQDCEAQLDASRPPGAEIAGAHFDYLIDCCRQQQGAIYVAEQDGRVCGFVVVLIEAEDEADRHLYEHYKRYAEVTDLVVGEAVRGSGCAQLLMQAAEQHALRCGVTTVRVSAVAGNEAARAFYGKSGYRSFATTWIKSLADT